LNKNHFILETIKILGTILRKKFGLLLMLSFGVASIFASPKGDIIGRIEQDSLIEMLKKKAMMGDKRAYRDLGYFIDTKQGKEIIDFLKDNTIVSENLLAFDVIKKSSFLNFYFNNEEKIKFSFLYNAFIVGDPQIRPIDYRITVLAKKIDEKEVTSKERLYAFNQFMVTKNVDSAVACLEELRLFNNNTDIPQTLSRWVKDKEIAENKAFRKKDFYRLLAENFRNYPSQSSYENIMYLVDNELLAPSIGGFHLAKITNVFTAHEGTDATITKRYRKYQDSLKTLEGLRAFGYARYGRFQRIFFEEEVDYLGALLATAAATDSYWWVRENALYDMLRTHHPRTLFYVASQYFKERNGARAFGFRPEVFMKILEQNVNESIQVRDENGRYVTRPNDLVSKKNYFLYWATHWNDYEWDEYLHLFVNKKTKLAQKDQYERLFRRLTNAEDSIAVTAYMELIKGEPNEIGKIYNKYRNLLRNVNPHIPAFKSKILENLAFLSDYCRLQNINYEITPDDKKLFDILLPPLTFNSRYVIENRLIEKLTLRQITSFEYWAILHESNVNASFSASRVLDQWYSKNFNQIFNDDLQFRLFCKKMSLFSQFGIAGNCNMYGKKINLSSPKIKEKVQRMSVLDPDVDITSALRQLLDKENKVKAIESENHISAENASVLFDALEKSDIITAEAFNDISTSIIFDDIYRERLLLFLPKITPSEDVFSLKIQPKLSVKNGDLRYLEKIDIGPKSLDDLPRVFEVDAPETLFEFIETRRKNFSIDENGTLINNLFRSVWFNNYVNNGLFTSEKANQLKNILLQYLEESELLSEFEEQATQRNILQLENIEKTLLEKIEAVNKTTLDESVRQKVLSEIIARVNYEDLGDIVPTLASLEEINNRPVTSFLSEDFGLPILNRMTPTEVKEFVEKHSKLSMADFYKFYLKKFGIDIWRKNDELDMAKIYHILKYDLVTPFTNAGGNKRDLYVYGVIKILEQKFLTSLGFHYKLNENQTFYAYNCSKRAEAWLRYLAENNIYRPEENEIRGFNQ
jgi:hypothetical protein